MYNGTDFEFLSSWALVWYPGVSSVFFPEGNMENLGQPSLHLKTDKAHLDYIFDMFELEVNEFGLLLSDGTESSWQGAGSCIIHP